MLLLAACVSVFTTIGIVYILVRESVAFFSDVPVWTFLTDTQWTPQLARQCVEVWTARVGCPRVMACRLT